MIMNNMHKSTYARMHLALNETNQLFELKEQPAAFTLSTTINSSMLWSHIQFLYSTFLQNYPFPKTPSMLQGCWQLCQTHENLWKHWSHFLGPFLAFELLLLFISAKDVPISPAETLKKNFVAHLNWEKNYIYYSQYTKLSKSEATIAHSLPLTLQLNNT